MQTMPATPDEKFGPWNPGLNSTVPSRLMPRVTLYDPRNSFVDWTQADELSKITGLKPQELAVTRPERLALHSVLIRVTSQLYVPDGPSYADLGISLRNMAKEIFDGFVIPGMDKVQASYDGVHDQATETVQRLLEEKIYGHPAPEKDDEPQGLLARLFAKPPPAKAPPDPTERAFAIATKWRDARNQDVDAASRRAIARVLSGVLNQRGALHIDREVLARVAVGLVMNRLGSAAVGKAVQDLFAQGVTDLGYRWLPPQEQPVVLNVKGASASGKSTVRTAQRGIAERAGYDWRDFAIISPDYWRKALIDYDALGEDYKYAAMMCGQELEAIDRKLDILMAVKGGEGTVPHMLIDRFRFDSFQRDRQRAEDSTLLTRFGAKVYMFFIVTPPAATVERAWARGLKTGRFKAVDDLLFHNVEAYAGMPDLFFRWATGREKWVHYEFLDNSVAEGEQPRTIAFGKNGKLTITDIHKLSDIDQFREVNVDARRPEDVQSRELSAHERTAFVRRAIKELTSVEVLVPGKNAIFARATDGQVTIDLAQLPAGIDPAVFGEFETSDIPLGNHDPSISHEVIGSGLAD